VKVTTFACHAFLNQIGMSKHTENAAFQRRFRDKQFFLSYGSGAPKNMGRGRSRDSGSAISLHRDYN